MSQVRKKAIIIGAGPGGLSSGMILAHRGFDVTVYEKQSYVGGRTSALKVGEFTFDLGPTFVMLPQVFEEVFQFAGRTLADYVDMRRVDPLYRLRFGDGRDFRVSFDKEVFKKEIARLFPGDEHGYDRYMKDQKVKFEKMYPCLKIPYEHWYDYLGPKLLQAFPHMDMFSSVHEVLSRYFTHEDMRISMAFQAKYLGMSPWNCPGPFTILSYIEHAYGIFHPIGGVHKITEAMAQVIQEEKGMIRLASPVSKILIENNKAVGVVLADGTVDRADTVIMNADFAAGMTQLVPEEFRPQWTNRRLEKSSFSCSTYMMYLGLDTQYDFEHHNIFFSQDYRSSIEEIFNTKALPLDPSIYVQNASVTDPTLAPKGKSTLYILVPVPNLEASIDWRVEKNRYRDVVLRALTKHPEMKGLEKHIEVGRMVTPLDWSENMNVYKGAVFNLAHTPSQMLYLRPHNRYERIPGLYLVGGGTHPGSGLPTILESGRITADLISNDVL